ncbi:hypothetical protein [Massilia sp. YIM B02443]|uniref:hypothetical protein n=1 Tax=Massilia sp. YIM B02443 TaxID=3050127 RepID=UPI0025B647CB|nr:hypothetical protein [Massilia sp. YIM B02443]MDN4038705.1 hypothetical protein [Massilia sp. YIM B02443]
MQHSVAPFRFRTAVCQGFLIVVFMLLAGCSGPLVKSAITSNIVQEEAHNAFLFLNIIRAQERMPMHFTQVDTVRAGPGGIGIGKPSLGLELPFGGGATNQFQFKPTFELSSNIDSISLVSQEFMRGITTPVNERLMVYFANQGWPHAMILHLFVGAIEVTDRDGRVIYSAHNSVYDANTFNIFRQVVKELDQCTPTLIEKKNHTFYSRILREADLKLEEMAAMKGAGLELVEVDTNGNATNDLPVVRTKLARFATVSKDYVLAFTETQKQPAANPVACSVGNIEKAETELDKLRKAFYEQNKANLASRSLAPSSMHVRFVMRSTQSMLYFLGELSRNRNAEALTIPIRGNREAALFVTTCCDKPAATSVSVEYQAKHYSLRPSNSTLENGVEDRSLQTLALVSLVYGLQNRSGEAPSIRNVRVIP